MNIKIELQDKKFMYLVSDGNSFTLCDDVVETTRLSKTGKPVKSESMRNPRYYSSIESACYGILQHGLLKSEATNFTELYRDLNFIKQQLFDLPKLEVSDEN